MKPLLLAAVTAAAVNAGVVISHSDLVAVQHAIFHDEAIASSWTTTNTFENVDVFVMLSQGLNNSGIPNNGDAYLTTAIGPSATVADEVAHTSFTFPSVHTECHLFSGLMLSPGTYYLTLFSNTTQGGGWLASESPGTYTLGSGVSKNNSLFSNLLTGGPSATYAPSSTFSDHATDLVYQPLYRVTGDEAPVPEPSSILLFALAGMISIASHVLLKHIGVR
jgi:hypothetical protein